MRNKEIVQRLWVSKDPSKKEKRVKLEKENCKIEEEMWLEESADIEN